MILYTLFFMFSCFIIFIYFKESKKRIAMEILATIHKMEQEILPDSHDINFRPLYSTEKLNRKQTLIDCQNAVYEKFLISKR